MKPLIKYPGGKTSLAPLIDEMLGPCTGTYFEPFVGAAAVLLHRKQAGTVDRVVASDVDRWIVDLHKHVRDDPESVCSALAVLRCLDWTPEVYATAVREANRWRGGAQAAALLIALSRAGFNGLYRKNAAGRWNVPWGKRRRLTGIPSDDAIREVSLILRDTYLHHKSVIPALERPGAGDHVYLDPPYLGGFTAYSGTSWTVVDQRQLVTAAEQAADRGARVVLSHSDRPEVRAMLGRWKIHEVSARGSMSCDGSTRGPRAEILAVIG